MDEGCVSATAARLFTRRLLANFLKMGRDEIAQVPLNEARMLSTIARLSDQMQLFALYTDNDQWAPERDCARLRQCGTHVRTAFVPHVRHAFPMQRQTYVPVSAVMRGWAVQTLKGFMPRGLGATDAGCEADEKGRGRGRGRGGKAAGGTGKGEGEAGAGAGGRRRTKVMVTSKL
jgi:uncharacterized membrane protein YgcG